MLRVRSLAATLNGPDWRGGGDKSNACLRRIEFGKCGGAGPVRPLSLRPERPREILSATLLQRQPCRSKIVTPHSLYLSAALQLVRTRLEDVRKASGRPSDVLIFVGRRTELVEELNRCWDTLPNSQGLPHPSDILAWL
jgi:hypothetical protein